MLCGITNFLTVSSLPISKQILDPNCNIVADVLPLEDAIFRFYFAKHIMGVLPLSKENIKILAACLKKCWYSIPETGPTHMSCSWTRGLRANPSSHSWHWPHHNALLTSLTLFFTRLTPCCHPSIINFSSGLNNAADAEIGIQTSAGNSSRNADIAFRQVDVCIQIS